MSLFTLILTFFVFTGFSVFITALSVEERGLRGPFGASNEVTASAAEQQYSFKDVEGVDEAKVSMP